MPFVLAKIRTANRGSILKSKSKQWPNALDKFIEFFPVAMRESALV